MEYQPSYPKWEFPAKSLPLSQNRRVMTVLPYTINRK